MEPGSPIGPGIKALLVYLNVTQAISLGRLNEIMQTVIGLDISFNNSKMSLQPRNNARQQRNIMRAPPHLNIAAGQAFELYRINSRYYSCCIHYHYSDDSGDRGRNDGHNDYTDAGADAAGQSAYLPVDADNLDHREVERAPLESDLDHVRPDGSDQSDHERQHVAGLSDHAAPYGC